MTRTKKMLITVAIAVAAVGGTTASAFAENHAGSTPADIHATSTR